MIETGVNKQSKLLKPDEMIIGKENKMDIITN